MSIFITAEIGINHNGILQNALDLIDIAVSAGCDAVKFQKRNISLVYSPEFLRSERISPWGHTQGEQKRGLEFGMSDYLQIDKFCREREIKWYCSVWDTESVKFTNNYDLLHSKIASAMIVNIPVLEAVAKQGRHTFISTGMSTLEQIGNAVDIFIKNNCPFELLHCVAEYPLEKNHANLKMIPTLRDRYGCDIGYSGHELGIDLALAAVGLGVTSIEKHITLSRKMYGSDQSFSLEPNELQNLIYRIRRLETAMGNGKKTIEDFEKPVAEKLRANIK